MAMEQVTIYDVAAAAGVSTATVSNVLNRPSRVSARTRQSVLEVVDRLGYIPKSEAVSKARKTMQRIGVIAPFTSYESFMRRLAGILAEASLRGIEVSVFDQESAATAQTPVLAALPIRGQLDGVIVMGRPIEATIERRLRDRRVPTVVVDSESSVFSAVACDDVAAGRVAAEHLLDLGHRQFGYILERQVTPYDSQALRRLAGFRAEVSHAGYDHVEVVSSEPSQQAAEVAARTLLDGVSPPSAILAHCDEMAMGVLRAARELGLTVPDDLTVMGFDDGPTARSVDLTTVRQPFEESGRLAAQLLFTAIDGRAMSRTVTYLNPTLVVRRTTAPAVRLPA